MTDPDPPRLPAASLRGFVAEALLKVGLPPKDAAICAELIVRADLHGADGHGIFRLPQYVRRIRGGAVNVKPKIRVAREAAGMALVDGDNGMGHVVMSFAAKTAIDKARTAGAAWVGVRNSNHAVAVPGNEGPIVLDMATSVAAYGKVKTAAQLGRTMPEGWMIDRQGRPLTDPKRAGEGMLVPIGGYKGYGLALVFGMLAGTLNGAAMGSETVDFNADDTTPTNTGHAIVAISIAAFGEVDEFKRRVDKLAREIRSSRPMPGVARIWLPGEQSRAKFEERSRLGIPITAPLRASLDKLAGELKIAALNQ